MDALSRLLQGGSACVALMIVDGQCTIAANELYKKSKKTNQCVKHIQAVMKYFREVASSKHPVDGEARLALLEKLFKGQLGSLRKDTRIPDGLMTQIIKQVVNRDEEAFLVPKKYKTHIEGAGKALFSFTRFYQDFCKVELEVMADMEGLFRNDFHILFESDEPGVHAEMQLLAKIIETGWYQEGGCEALYFGISKLCCLHCHEMISAANTVFEADGVKCQVASSGTHALSFGKWVAPAIFKKEMVQASDGGSGAASASSKDGEAGVAMRIARLAHQRIRTMLQLEAPKDVYMQTSMSGSSPGDPSRICLEAGVPVDDSSVLAFLCCEPLVGSEIASAFRPLRFAEKGGAVSAGLGAYSMHAKAAAAGSVSSDDGAHRDKPRPGES